MEADAAFYAREFMRQLKEHSIDKENPIPEWKLLDTMKHHNDPHWCICSKEIRNLFFIQNKKTDEVLQIGCDCAKRWMDCSLNCAMCDRGLKNTMKRRAEENYFCSKCHKVVLELQERRVWNGKEWKTFFDLAQNKELVNCIVNKVKRTLAEEQFLGYCRLFYEW